MSKATTPGPTFPAGFEALEPLGKDWLADSQEGRKQLRITRSHEERQRFYDLAGPFLPEALAHLDKYPLAELAQPERNLLQVMQALGHVALAIEHYGRHEAVHARHLAGMTVTRSSSAI